MGQFFFLNHISSPFSGTIPEEGMVRSEKKKNRHWKDCNKAPSGNDRTEALTSPTPRWGAICSSWLLQEGSVSLKIWLLVCWPHSGWAHTHGVYGQPKMNSLSYKKEATTREVKEIGKGVGMNLKRDNKGIGDKNDQIIVSMYEILKN